MDTEVKKHTPEEVLMDCLADAERIKDVLIIVRTEDAVEWHCSDSSICIQLGMLDFVQANARKMASDEGTD